MRPCADPAAPNRFEALSIWNADGGRWRSYRGRYPVVMLSLKEAAVGSWDDVRRWLALLLAF